MPDEQSSQLDPMLTTPPLDSIPTPSTQPLVKSTQEKVIDLHLKLPEAAYKDLMERKFDKVIQLIKSIGPPPPPMKFPSWRDVKKRTNKVAIVGFADSKILAPFKDETFEIWGLNSLFEAIPRWDRWFEIHQRELFNLDTNKEIGLGLTRTGEPYMSALAKMTCPIYMTDAYPDIPTSIRYPVEEIIAELHPEGSPPNAMQDWTKDLTRADWNGYFTNSISYMIALAIYEKYEQIDIYGVDMATVCVAPETRVLTADLRWVPASEIEVGDELMAFDEEPKSPDRNSRRWRKTVVTSAPKLIRPCYHVSLEDGTEMVVSAKHGWLTHAEHINRWKTTDSLVTKHHIDGRPTRIVKLLPTWGEDNSREAGYLAAAFDGEGHLCQTERKDMKFEGYDTLSHMFRIGFSQNENAMAKEVERLLNHYQFIYSKNEGKEGKTFKYHINGGRTESLRFLGQIRPPRLLDKFYPDKLGQLTSMENVAVIDSQFIGDQMVIGLETETKTFIAEGFASHNSEYSYQRSSCEFYVGIAIGRGIKVYIPNQADLLKNRYMYGYENDKEDRFKAKVDQLIKSMNERYGIAMQNRDFAQKQIDQYIGAMECSKEMNKIWENCK